MADNAKQVALSQQTAQKGVVDYQVAGKDVHLTMDLVRASLIHGDSSKVTNAEIWNFMCLCQFNQLNPFLNEAYLVKYGSDSQMIVGKEAFLKRADACPDYEGFEAGVIVKTADGKIKENVGNFFAPDEILIGGWADIYRKGRRPVRSRVRLAEYNTGKSNWASKPATMIAKVAKVQGLREAFPNQLGAMYTEDEMGAKPAIEDAVAVEIKENANGETLTIDPVPAAPAPAAGKPADDPYTAGPAF